jgi:hypothetical protein
MAAHIGPASLRPRCTRSGSSVAAIPVYQSTHLKSMILRTHTAYSTGDGKQRNVAAVGTKPALGVIASNVHYCGGGELGWIVRRIVRPVG